MDVAVANYVEKERPQLDIKRVEKGKYTISNVNVSLRLNDGEIQVKSGSVLYITLTEYLTIKLQNIGATLLDIASNSPEGKAAAKKKFDVYPSAYANAWAAKWYKSHGGGWRMGKGAKK